jgi:hypothetical protein
MYRFTEDEKFRRAKDCGVLLHHPNLPKTKIPYWDFNAHSQCKKRCISRVYNGFCITGTGSVHKGKEARICGNS